MISALIHSFLIFFGVWYDARQSLRYTDIDYWVFWEAGEAVLAGLSPYTQPVYRYTPLLSWMMTPFVFLDWRIGGKLLFSAIDLLVGWLLYENLKGRKHALYLVALGWLLNPLILGISTRGSAESIICLFVLLFVRSLQGGSWDASALLLGLATHWKIFPVIYGLTAVSYIGLRRRPIQAIWFFTVSASTFFLLTGLSTWIYGFEGLYGSLLYHLARQDVRHNFSPYFYAFYMNGEGISAFYRLVSFLPQFIPIVFFAFRYGGRDPIMACFLQTISFVTLNKVCTSQVERQVFSISFGI